MGFMKQDSETFKHISSAKFIKDENKHIASLTMESIAIHLLDKKLTTPTELQALYLNKRI